MQQGRSWRGEDVAGWYASEKLDGCFARWDGGKLWSKSGRLIDVPGAWRSRLPRMCLEGEVWGGRGQFESTCRAVVHGAWAPHVCFFVFDAPEARGDWAARVTAAKERIRCKFAAVVPWCTIEDLEHARRWVRSVRLGGGEGLMLYKPGLEYRPGRTAAVLKLKKDPVTSELAWRERRVFFRRAA